MPSRPEVAAPLTRSEPSRETGHDGVGRDGECHQKKGANQREANDSEEDKELIGNHAGDGTTRASRSAMTVVHLSLLISILGLIVYLIPSSNGKVSNVGEKCFWVGLLAFLLTVGAARHVILP